MCDNLNLKLINKTFLYYSDAKRYAEEHNYELLTKLEDFLEWDKRNNMYYINEYKGYFPRRNKQNYMFSFLIKDKAIKIMLTKTEIKKIKITET